MFRPRVLAGFALAVAALMTSSASAQLGGRGFQIPAAAQNIMLLNSEAVQKELALKTEQTKQISDLASQMQSDAMEIFSGLQDLTPEERTKELPNLMKMMTEKGKDLQKKVDNILDAKQQARIRELSLQRRGVQALDDDEVVTSLKLSDEQKKTLGDLRDEVGKASQAMIQGVLGGGGGDQGEIRQKLRAMQKEFGEKALAVLTTEQREQFEKMKGTKFEFPAQRGFGF